VSERWIDESTAASQHLNETCGLLWWRIMDDATVGITDDDLALWKSLGADTAVVDKLHPVVGRTFPTEASLRGALEEAAGGRREWWSVFRYLARHRVQIGFTHASGPLLGFAARGWLGQYLVVVPSASLVAVRMRRATRDDYGGGAQYKYNGYVGFEDDVLALAGVKSTGHATTSAREVEVPQNERPDDKTHRTGANDAGVP
jgi:hypothetical protein